jgi:outer membrane immunogenic protein
MIYVKGGAAWARDKYDFNGLAIGSQCNFLNLVTGACAGFAPAVTTPFGFAAASETRPGWTFGAGIEWALWNYWSIKAEYDYLDLGRRTVSFISPTLPGASFDVTQRIQEVKVGLNYKFPSGFLFW